jgi:hypothetical protein
VAGRGFRLRENSGFSWRRAKALLALIHGAAADPQDGGDRYIPEIDGGKNLSRGLPLVKWLLAIPLYIVGVVYAIYGFIMLVLGWLNILFTGTMSSGSADAIVRVTQFWNRIYGYAVLLVTDEYPSFSL